MPIVVQKFGGSSLADPDRMRRCATRAADARRTGADVIVVVSAMGDTTDRLLALAERVNPRPSRRELDLLLSTGEQSSAALMAMALQVLGVDAISFCGHQLGIMTDPAHCRAKIRSIDRQRIDEQLGLGRVVVAVGFQGVTESGQLTTLGRGGSDLTAVALAAAMNVDEIRGACEIYTDVDGVFTADPRHVPDARKIERISFEEMLELASLGAGVLHCRAAMFAQKYGVPLHIRHSQKQETGTMVTRQSPDMESVAVVGSALARELGRITLRGLPRPRPGRSAPQAIIFRHIAEAGVLVDDIVQTNVAQQADVAFTAANSDLEALTAAARRALDEIGEGALDVQTGLAKVSVVGVGMRTHTGVAATMFGALDEAGVAIHNITTSEIKISCIVAESEAEEALRAVHRAFRLERAPGAGDDLAACAVEVKTDVALGATPASNV